MKNLASIILASALSLTSCATNTYENHFKKEKISLELIQEISKKYDAKEGYISAKKGNELLREFWVNYELREGQSITLEPVYGPYTKAPSGQINILLKTEEDLISRRIIGKISQTDVTVHLYGELK